MWYPQAEELGSPSQRSTSLIPSNSVSPGILVSLVPNVPVRTQIGPLQTEECDKHSQEAACA